MDISILGALLKITGGLFAFLAALFTFLSVAQNEKHAKTQAWFRKKWESVNRSWWVQMPERVIRAVIRGKDALGEWYIGLIGNENNRFLGIMIIYSSLLFIAGMWIYLGLAAMGIVLIVWASIIILLMIMIFRVRAMESRARKLRKYISRLFLFPQLFGASLIWTAIALRADLLYAVISIIIASPSFFFIGLPIVLLLGWTVSLAFHSALTIFCQALSLSFVITFLSLLLGNLITPSAHVPQTLQMLLANVFFDGVTMVITFTLLAWAIRREDRSWRRIPAALVLDLLAAALLAWASLYFGLLLSENHLSPQQVLFVLIAKAPSGEGVELGPYFWAMHTTFLPTLFYLTVILIAWLGKTLLVPARWFFGKGHEHKNPLKLTAALCTLLAAFFFLSGLAVDTVEKRAEEQEGATRQAVSEVPPSSYLARVDMVLMGTGQPMRVPLTLGVEGGRRQ